MNSDTQFELLIALHESQSITSTHPVRTSSLCTVLLFAMGAQALAPRGLMPSSTSVDAIIIIKTLLKCFEQLKRSDVSGMYRHSTQHLMPVPRRTVPSSSIIRQANEFSGEPNLECTDWASRRLSVVNAIAVSQYSYTIIAECVLAQ